MEQQGLTVLSSTTLFDHWFRPVCSIVAKAKGNGSTATTVEELENENELLRLQVQELSDALLQSKLGQLGVPILKARLVEVALPRWFHVQDVVLLL